MFLQRALITFTLGPLALYFIYMGGWPYALPIMIVMVLATVEYKRMMERIGWQLSLWVLLPTVVMLWLAGMWQALDTAVPTLGLALLLAMAYGLWLYERENSVTATGHLLAMAWGIVLMGWVASHFFRLRGLETFGWQWTMLAMMSNWMGDSGAYLVGKFMAGRFILGRHPMSPRLSPNKTIEGLVGGIVISTAVTTTLAFFLGVGWLPGLILGLAVSLLSPLGDLGISLLKREADMKDSGQLFPGHGGALDRVDSLIWAVMIGYYVALWLNNSGI